MDETGRLLTLRECASRTSTSEAFWRKLVTRRLIRVHKLGRLTRVAERDLEAMLRVGFPSWRPPSTRSPRGTSPR
jgi:excisionase family DNA binding protein